VSWQAIPPLDGAGWAILFIVFLCVVLLFGGFSDRD